MTVSKAKTFRNVLYTALTKGVTLACIAVTTSVVARNISASDYGVIGFAAISNPNIGSNPAYFIHASGTMPEMQESVLLLPMAESRK